MSGPDPWVIHFGKIRELATCLKASVNVNGNGKVKGGKKKKTKTNDLEVLINGRYFIGRSMNRKCDHEKMK